MPIYEYECPECGNNFELLRSVSDSGSEAECPKCGAENARRVVSSFATSSGGFCAPRSST